MSTMLPWPSHVYHQVMTAGTENIRENLKGKEYFIATGIDQAETRLPQCLITFGLSRFGMAEVCMMFQPDDLYFTPKNYAGLMNMYIDVCRWDHNQHLSKLHQLFSAEDIGFDESPFANHHVKAHYVNTNAFLHGYGLSIKDAVIGYDPKIIQLVVSDKHGRFPGQRGFTGPTQVILP